MRVGAFVCMALLLGGAAGCLGEGEPGEDPSVDVGVGTETTDDEDWMPAGPVSISESGAMRGTFSNAWTWDVAPTHRSHVVTLVLTGPQGAPQYVFSAADIVLARNGEAQQELHVIGHTSAGGEVIALVESGDTSEGEWTLTIEVAGGLADYVLAVAAA